MADNLNVNTNFSKWNIGVEFREDSLADMVPSYEEVTIMKTEVKEEVYDFEMSVDDIEHVNIKEEYNNSVVDNFKEENLEVINSREQSLNENIISGNCQLGEEGLQKEQKLSKKRLYLKCKKAERRNSLKRRVLMKQDGEPKKYKCAHCKYATCSKYNLPRHIRIHTNDRPFKCMYKNCVCTAGQEESCKCDVCEYAATQNSALKVHILRKHSAEPKKYKCAECEYTTNIKEALKRHSHTHTKDKPFKCTYKDCQCTAEEKKSCRCDMCGYATTEEHNLKVHILIKHSAEPEKFKCADCQYATHRKENLKRHIRTHIKDRPF